jgi:large conductance mechanosensitive channel
MFREFKEFAMKGNVLDMAIGIIIGAAFGKIITSFVATFDAAFGQNARKNGFQQPFHQFVRPGLSNAGSREEAGAATINYGIFFNTIIDFIIVAFAIFC